ncbi:MAG TPA: DUF3302 domain-containing protein [Gemmataceae bacterium]|jgi:hypothetical protein|nr:DUF3302 domain-containing protein [Gemmataceae bacterium]
MHLTSWDYLTFLTLFIVVAGAVGVAIFILGLPGRIAIARNHPDAEAVNLMGWLGFLAIVPWVQAFIWAFKPTNIIDIRRFPPEEQRAIKEQIARLTGKEEKEPPAEPRSTTPPAGSDK